MRRGFGMGAFLAAISMAPAVAMAPHPVVLEEERATPRLQGNRKRTLAQAPARYRRSKGAQAKRKGKANRLHISKRVRRKHRRAA